MFGTVLIYAVIIVTLNFRLRNMRTPPPSVDIDSDAPFPTALNVERNAQITQELTNRATRYLILYPCIYVVCTLPLAAGRMAAMTGVNIGNTYFCIAGAMIASNGWLDVLLYGFTRGSIVFGHDRRNIDGAATGLESFLWSYGNGEVWKDQNWGTVTVVESGARQDGDAENPLQISSDSRKPSGLGRRSRDEGNRTPSCTRTSSSSKQASSKWGKKRAGTTASTEDLYTKGGNGMDYGSGFMLGLGFMGSEMYGGGISIQKKTTVDVQIAERRGGGYELRDVGGLASMDDDKEDRQASNDS